MIRKTSNRGRRVSVLTSELRVKLEPRLNSTHIPHSLVGPLLDSSHDPAAAWGRLALDRNRVPLAWLKMQTSVSVLMLICWGEQKDEEDSWSP